MWFFLLSVENKYFYMHKIGIATDCIQQADYFEFRYKKWYPKEQVKKVFTLPTDNLRGLGIWDMMLCYERGEVHRNNPEMIFHVMEVLTKLNIGETNEEPMIKSSIENMKPWVCMIGHQVY